jgi:4-alpha-glucanotransferase
MDGIIGKWKQAPGERLLATLQQKLGQLPFVAEDLGIITDEVTALRHAFELPGMKILQFAFGGDDSNPYLPANHEENSVVYTGTHDNDTTLGWFTNADTHTREHALSVLGTDPEAMPWALIESAMASIARLAIIPMQDLLALGSEARFNTPGTLEGNWSWRIKKIPPAGAECWVRSQQLIERYR